MSSGAQITRMLNPCASQADHGCVASPVLTNTLTGDGFTDLRRLMGQTCAVKKFNFTTALVVGLDGLSYQRRYCYEHRADAQTALQAWDGRGHPSGPWIKCKGAGIDLLNPDFV